MGAGRRDGRRVRVSVEKSALSGAKITYGAGRIGGNISMLETVLFFMFLCFYVFIFIFIIKETLWHNTSFKPR